MDLATLGGLVVLALVDSTSFGTLGVPVWMLVQPRLRVPAVLTYLAVIAAFYWVLGLALLGGVAALAGATDELRELSEGRGFLWAQLVVGVALFAASFVFDRKRVAARRERRGGAPTRMERWTARAVGPDATMLTVAGLAVGAGLVEGASMLPYLAAVGLIVATGTGFGTGATVLAGYVVVMVLPALLLLASRLALHDRLTPLLDRVAGWMRRGTSEALAWGLAIVGVLLVLDATRRLGLLGS